MEILNSLEYEMIPYDLRKIYPQELFDLIEYHESTHGIFGEGNPALNYLIEQEKLATRPIIYAKKKEESHGESDK